MHLTIYAAELNASELMTVLVFEVGIVISW